MIPISDLRKGNLIKTEYGILPVYAIIFQEVQVKGKDGRILWVKEAEGVDICKIDYKKVNRDVLTIMKTAILGDWIFIHEMQNYYYWHNRKELEISLHE